MRVDLGSPALAAAEAFERAHVEPDEDRPDISDVSVEMSQAEARDWMRRHPQVRP